MMNILITGANGFIAKNLQVHLAERKEIYVLNFTRANQTVDLIEMIKEADFIFHLAGVNRPQTIEEFKIGNTDLTHALCEGIAATGKKIPLLYTSSTQAAMANPYGESKCNAEKIIWDYANAYGFPAYIYRLPNVFGKWAKPHYNSAIATFCHQITRDLPIQINDPNAEINLVYVDDVIAHFLKVLDGKIEIKKGHLMSIDPIYKTTVGELAHYFHAFRANRNHLVIEAVGKGLTRALYSTYMSYLPEDQFSYRVPKYEDSRGTFVEMIKTKDAGQVSFFTAHPGVTRGEHYHHSKTEKFLVIKGKAHFRFRQLLSENYHEIFTDGTQAQIVETIPGWTHDITNVGEEEMIVMIWANEIFDRQAPDTYARHIK